MYAITCTNPLNVKKKVVLPVVRTALDSFTFQAMLCSYIIAIFHMRTSTARTCFPGSHASTQHVSQNIAEHLQSPRWGLETWKALMPLSPKSGAYMPGNTLPRWAAAVSPYSRIQDKISIYRANKTHYVNICVCICYIQK